MRLSACMIAKNEEKTIARCINSYIDLVDEVVVIDTGSTDDTISIAKELGAKVFHFTWNDHFAEAKNFALSKVKGDWVIFLDADEYFAANMARNIRPLIKRLDKTFNAIACKMINIDDADGSFVDVITHVRIFKNNKYIKYVNPIHEMLINVGNNKKIHAFLADENELLIYHTGYSVNSNRKKAERNLELLLKDSEILSIKPTMYQYISDCYFGLEEWEKTIEYARLFLNSKAKFVGYNVKPYQNIIDAMLRLRYPFNQIMCEVNQAIEKFPNHPLFCFYKANLLFDSKKYRLAYTTYKLVVELQKKYDDIEINSMSANMQYVYFHLGIINEHQNDYNNAIENYIETLKLNNKHSQCFDRLMMLIRNQKDQDVILFINTLYNIDEESVLDFITTRLVNHALPKVLAYYTNLREKKYGKQDFILLQMLVANKYYEKAFPSLLDCYMQDSDEQLAVVTAAAAMLSNNSEFTTRCSKSLPISLNNIIKAYCGEFFEFASEDKSAFLNLVHIFICWANDKQLQQLLALSDYFKEEIAVDLGNLFLQEGYYDIALQFYEYILSGSKEFIDPSLYYYQAYCLHRLCQYDAATKSFVNAYKMGYESKDIFEFLHWNLASINKLDIQYLKALEILKMNDE